MTDVTIEEIDAIDATTMMIVVIVVGMMTETADVVTMTETADVATIANLDPALGGADAEWLRAISRF